MSTSKAPRGRLTTKGRLLTGWWWGFVMAVFLASAPLLADQDKDLLDLESGALALSATTQFLSQPKILMATELPMSLLQTKTTI